MTPEQFLKENPDVVSSIRDEAKADGFKEGHDAATEELNERFNALSKSFPNDPAFVVEQFNKGNDVARAKAERSDILDKRLKELEAENAKLREQNEGPDALRLDAGKNNDPDSITPDDMWEQNIKMSDGRRCHDVFGKNGKAAFLSYMLSKSVQR